MKRFINNYQFIILSTLIFLILTLPFLTVLPYLDGNIDFIQTADFLQGGLNQYFSNWNSVHPPLKLLLDFFFYKSLGVSSLTYSLPGILLGVIGIFGIFFLSKELFDKKTANLSVLIFSAYPLIISNSIFFMRDYALTIFMVLSLLCLLKNKYLFAGVFLTFSVLTKETGLILPIIALSMNLIAYLTKKIQYKKVLNTIFLAIPIASYFIWAELLRLSNKKSWDDWIFTNTHGEGVFYVIINNILSFKFLNPYAFEHWKQILFLNFNWIYISITLIMLIYLVKGKIDIKQSFQKKLVFLVIFLFIFTYLLTVLSLQTYTIPRYALPLIPFIIIFLSKSITSLKNKTLSYSLTTLVLCLVFVSLFFSADPVAKRIWGENKIFNQTVYGLSNRLAGNDGLTYNLQYLLIAKDRSNLIYQANKNNGIIKNGYCRWIFPDPINEYKMLKLLNLEPNIKCTQ